MCAEKRVFVDKQTLGSKGRAWIEKREKNSAGSCTEKWQNWGKELAIDKTVGGRRG